MKLSKSGIPLVIINGRISPNSYKGYKKMEIFFKEILKNYSYILMQTEDDKKRIIDIGASESITKVMGNLKLDMKNILNKEEICSLKASLELDNHRVLIAGSTHSGEDEIILRIFKKLKHKFPDIKLLIAPRHPERTNSVIKLLAATGFSYGLRSKNSTFAQNEIILVDTIGELGKLYSITYAAFIGGSFSETGGHNPLEASIYGVPVLSGSAVYNFKDIYNLLISANAAIITNNEEELYDNFDTLLLNAEKYSEMSFSSKKIFKDNKGVVDFAIKNILSFYSER